MNVLLISTDNDIWALGLRSISAVLRAAGHTPSLVLLKTSDLRLDQNTLDDLGDLARDLDVVGISSLAQGSEKAKQVIEYLRPMNKLIVWGGVHASLNPEECADYADIVCQGEGEGMMVELLEKLEQGQDWREIENIVFRENGALMQNPIRPPIFDLDTLPLPDYSFEHEYHLTSNGLEQAETLEELAATGRVIFNSSRGCAFQCTYCCNVKLKNLYGGKNRYVRRMSVDRLLEHTRNLRRIFPQATNFYFIDEDFGARPLNELAQLAEEFPRQIGLPFECLTHPAQVSVPKMDLLVKAGLFRVNIGVESGSERTRREVYNRHISNEVVKRAAKIINQYPQVSPYYLFITTNPYEDRSDLLATARLISELPYNCNFVIYNLVFFPGSFLYERAVQDKLIEGKQDSGFELNYLGKFHYQNHPWKNKHLYLNGLLFLMVGSSTRWRIGILPRFLINFLLGPRLVELGEDHTAGIRALIALKYFITGVNRLGGRLLHRRA